MSLDDYAFPPQNEKMNYVTQEEYNKLLDNFNNVVKVFLNKNPEYDGWIEKNFSQYIKKSA